MNEIKPIETHYKGYRFRSRLEARWAVFFDAANLAWEYEKQGYMVGDIAYLPDFWLPKFGFFEVKPDRNIDFDFFQKFSDLSDKNIIIACGNIPYYQDDVFGLDDDEHFPLYPVFPNREAFEKEHPSYFFDFGMGYYYQWNTFGTDDDRPGERVYLIDEANVGMKQEDPKSWDESRHTYTRKYRNVVFKQAFDAARAARFEFGEKG